MFSSKGTLAVLGFGVALAANAQWWNPLATKTLDECILQNMKGVTSNDAATLVAQACARQFPPTESAEGQRKKKLLERCGLDADHWKTRALFALDGKSIDKTAGFIRKITRLSFDAQRNWLKIQNNNDFGLSGVMIGFARGKTCPSSISSYDATVYCAHAISSAGVGANSYGTFACNEVPSEVKGYGICVIGISPIYDQFNDDLPNWMIANGYCAST